MEKNNYFIITIDTEADNQWVYNHPCTTENSKYLPRFQELAEKYGFKPVWLTSYEMACDDFFVNYFKNKLDKNLCEIGMHLHAWSCPPHEYKLKKKYKQREYLIEYPPEIMNDKIKAIDNLLTKKFKKPVSHRSGRWSTNEDYFKLLNKHKYLIDCSITPHVSWKKTKGASIKHGSDYSRCDENPYIINEILEVPVSVKKLHYINQENMVGFIKMAKEVFYYITGRVEWLRPNNQNNIIPMKMIIDECVNRGQHAMFMIHSSELMPGGSPYFTTDEAIEELYIVMEELFAYAKAKGFRGATLEEYYYLHNNISSTKSF